MATAAEREKAAGRGLQGGEVIAQTPEGHCGWGQKYRAPSVACAGAAVMTRCGPPDETDGPRSDGTEAPRRTRDCRNNEVWHAGQDRECLGHRAGVEGPVGAGGCSFGNKGRAGGKAVAPERQAGPWVGCGSCRWPAGVGRRGGWGKWQRQGGRPLEAWRGSSPGLRVSRACVSVTRPAPPPETPAPGHCKAQLIRFRRTPCGFAHVSWGSHAGPSRPRRPQRPPQDSR